jgi:hypothetical protein
MSTICIIAPVIVTGWPLITAAVTASVTTLGYAVAADQAHAINDCLQKYNEEYDKEYLANKRVSEEITFENSEILADAHSRGETLTVVKDNIKATFHRDIRGALRLTIDAVGLSKAEIRKIGEELIGRVTQQYAYNRLMTEMKDRGMIIVEESVEEDDTVKIRVRNTI